MRARYREGLGLLALGAALASLFGLWPQLDLTVSGWFYGGAGSFPLRDQAVVRAVYLGVPRVGTVLVVVALCAVASVALPRPWRISRPRRRKALALLLGAALGTGLLVHDVIKDSFNRPRPRETQEFGGTLAFVPAMRVGREGHHRESFVSGHVAGGTVLMALGLFGAPATRRRWLLVGWGLALVVGAVRIMQGGHYLSDVLFCGWAIWLVCWLIRECWLRVAAGRTRRRRAGTTR
jgi:lipid A 4'-phosphatase